MHKEQRGLLLDFKMKLFNIHGVYTFSCGGKRNEMEACYFWVSLRETPLP